MADQKNSSYDLYAVTFSSSEIKTVWEYINNVDSPLHSEYFINNPDKLLDVKSGDKTNRQRIEAAYITQEEIEKKGSGVKELLIKVGTILYIPAEHVQKSALLTQVNNVIHTNEPLFKAIQLASLEQDLGYVAINKSDQYRNSVIKQTVPGLTVWIWCRALSDSKELEGKIFDLTPFIQTINTNTTINGGNFQITLPPVIAGVENDEWGLRKQAVMFTQESVISSDNIHVEDEGGDEGINSRNRFLFHNIISSNDIIFIRHESLEMELEQRQVDADLTDVSSDNLPNRIYDMIGLVDSSSLSYSAESNEATISITGRDFSKLFIDDGSYFFPLELSQGHLKFVGESQAHNSLARRLISGKFMYLNLYFNTSIENIFKFIIAQVANIKVAPNSLFEGWGDRRAMITTSQDTTSPAQKISNDAENKAIDLIKSERRSKGLIVDPVEEDIKAQSIYAVFKSFIRQGLKTKKIILVGSVIQGWSSFDYIHDGSTESVGDNQYPQSLKEDLGYSELEYYPNLTIASAVYEALQLERSNPKHKNRNNQEVMPGVWGIVKLVIDEQVAFRRVVDSSLSSANGSLLNFLNKACQKPFVELMMDTYGDEYVITVRKPPHDKDSIIKYINQRTVNTNLGLRDGFLIDIEDVDVLKVDLSFSDEVYTWYHFTPQGNFIGSAGQYSLLYLPAVLVPEYADIWGSRPLQVVHNYMNFVGNDPSSHKTLSNAEKQAFVDYKYVIDCHSYLPFSRRGVIVLNRDRRIKVGSVIYLKMTGEIFFVDAVKHSTSISSNQIDATTTIEVSRGLIRAFLLPYNIPGTTESVSYFDIVECKLNLDATKSVPKYKTVAKTVTETISVPAPPEEQLQDTHTTDKDMKSINYNPNSVVFRVPQDKGQMNKFLLTDLYSAAQKTGFKLTIGTAITGHGATTSSGGPSRHPKGTAVDINQINGVSYGSNKNLFTTWANELKRVLISMGYQQRESGNTKAVLFGFNDASRGGNHFNHLHVSNTQRSYSESSLNASSKMISKQVDRIIEEKVQDGYETIPDLDRILEVKVNKTALDFFLKRKQFLTTQ